MNSGSIRATFTEGPVTGKKIFEVLPFMNEVVVIPMNGAVLRQVLTHSISLMGMWAWQHDGSVYKPGGAGRFLQLSSTLRFKWKLAGGIPTVMEIEIDRYPTQKDGAAVYQGHPNAVFKTDAGNYFQMRQSGVSSGPITKDVYNKAVGNLQRTDLVPSFWPVTDSTIVTIAANEFTASGGDGYSMLKSLSAEPVGAATHEVRSLQL